MRAIPSNVWQHLEKLIDAGVFVWTYCIRVTPTQAYYLTANSSSITVNSIEYKPYPISHERVDDNGEGDLTEIIITLSNVGRMAMPHLEADQWDQAPVTISLVFVPSPDSDTGVRFTCAVQRVTATDETVSLHCAANKAMSRPIPPERFERDLGYLALPVN